MGCPTQSTVLDILHIEEANGIASAHNSKGSGQTIPHKLKSIIVALLLLEQFPSY
jgi:hypothetical protein